MWICNISCGIEPLGMHVGRQGRQGAETSWTALDFKSGGISSGAVWNVFSMSPKAITQALPENLAGAAIL
jgi:hypothetical protein